MLLKQLVDILLDKDMGENDFIGIISDDGVGTQIFVETNVQELRTFLKESNPEAVYNLVLQEALGEEITGNSFPFEVECMNCYLLETDTKEITADRAYFKDEIRFAKLEENKRRKQIENEMDSLKSIQNDDVFVMTLHNFCIDYETVSESYIITEVKKEYYIDN